MKQHVLSYSLDELPVAARALYQCLSQVKIVALMGGLGLGKTTLIKELLLQCGIYDVVQSPTFTYVSIYTNAMGDRFYHFDLYRIRSMQEFLQQGFGEYLYEPHSCTIIEWPEVILPLLTHKTCFVQLEYVNDESRCMRYYCVE